MKRVTWNSFCLFSLLVFTVSVAIWVESYFFVERFSLTRRPVLTLITSHEIWYSKGVISIQRSWVVLESPDTQAWTGWNHERTRPAQNLYQPTVWNGQANPRFAGFQIASDDSFSMIVLIHTGYFIFPLWIFLPTLIPPLLWLRRWKRNRGRGFQILPPHPSTHP